MSQAIEYRLTHARIPSLPDPDNVQRSDSFDAFTRVDSHPVTPVEVPNRLLVRATVPVVRKWSAGALLEIRDGFPYSLIDEDQAFVGARNTGGRLPALCTLDVSLLRLWRVLGREVRYGVKVFHVLGSFEPRDVQNNIDSAAFGSLYNGLLTRVMFTLQLTAK